MVTIIDGHNLIPKIHGLSLDQPDDENRLIELLQNYSRVRRKNIEVFFDRAAIGRAGSYMAGTVRVTHVSERTTADESILQRVLKAGKRAQELIVVSSDHHIQNQTRALGAKTQSSEQFASELYSALSDAQTSNPAQTSDRRLSEEEIRDWLDFFNSEPPTKYSNKD